MIYGITGNPTKPELWTPVSKVVEWFRDNNYDF